MNPRPRKPKLPAEKKSRPRIKRNMRTRKEFANDIEEMFHIDDADLARFGIDPDKHAVALSKDVTRHQAYQNALAVHQHPLPDLIPMYECMRLQVAECRRVDEAKDINDKAEALRAYARQRHDHALEITMAEIKLRAFRRIGEISAELDKAPGPGRGKKKRCPSGETSFPSKIETLKKAGISRASANRAEHVSRVPEAEFEAEITKAREQNRPVGAEDVLHAVMRLRPLKRAMDWTCLDGNGVVELFRVEGSGDGPGLEVWQAAERLREEEKFALILALLVSNFPAVGNPYSWFHSYRQLLLRLLHGNQLVEALASRLREVPPHRRKVYLDQVARVSDELEQYLAVDQHEVMYPEEEEPAPGGEEPANA